MCSTSSSSPTPAAPPTPTLSAPASPPPSALLWEEDHQAAAPVASVSAVASLLAAAAPSVSTTPTSEAPVSQSSHNCRTVVLISPLISPPGSEDTSPCTATVCKSSSDICYLRLEFSTFSTSSPLTTTYTNDSPNGRSQCQSSQFSASSNGLTVPVLCGTNTGYHMILNAEVGHWGERERGCDWVDG